VNLWVVLTLAATSLAVSAVQASPVPEGQGREDSIAVLFEVSKEFYFIAPFPCFFFQAEREAVV
jgi:hypothetical protein